MKFFTLKKSVIICSLIFIAGIIMIQSCVTVAPPPPPLPDELKYVQFVYGWTVTRELEETCKSVRMEKVSRSAYWWAIHKRAHELKANVAQLVFDCAYNCDVRFWACGKSFLPDTKKDATKVFGDFIGNVSDVKGNEITITGKNIAEKAQMGAIFAVEAGKKMVYIEVTFPMMTLAKCKVIKGSAKDVKTGMKVYTKPKKKKK